MKREKWISAFWAFLLGSLLSCGAMMCLVSAFHLRIDTGTLLLWCIGASAVCSVCYTLPLSPLPLGAGAVALGFLWRSQLLESGTEAILNRLSRQYNNAYNWGIIRWSFRTADDMEPLILVPLCIWGVLIALLATWAICRRKTIIPVLLATLLPSSACFVVTDTVPSSGWLYPLILAFLVLLLTGNCRRQDEKAGNRLTLWLTPITALCLLVLLAAIPRSTYSGQENAKKMVETIFHSDPLQRFMGHMDESGATGGDSGASAVDLRSVGYRVENEAQVLQVTAPFTGNLYLRGRAFDVYDGTSWTKSGTDYGTLPWPKEGLKTVGEVTITTRFAHQMLYMPYYSDTMQLLDVSTGMENSKKLSQYSFQCKQLEDPALLSRYYPTSSTAADPQQAELTDTFMKSFTNERPLPQWSRSVALAVSEAYSSPYHKAQAIASYVRNSAKYDTQTSRMPLDSTDFAQWFLEESDTGYCVHFATSAAVLLQAAGLPARYVTGYLVPVKAGESTPVLSNQAHAWVEYWLPGHGWTVLEATPSASLTPPRPTQSTAATEPTVTEPEETLPEVTQEAPTQQFSPTPEKKSSGIWSLVLLALGGLTVIIGLLEGQRKLRLTKQQKVRAAAEPNRLALLYWAALVRYAKHLKELPDEKLFAIAQMAKYSQHTVTDAQLARFKETEAASITRLKTKNRLLRLYYRWILVLY